MHLNYLFGTTISLNSTAAFLNDMMMSKRFLLFFALTLSLVATNVCAVNREYEVLIEIEDFEIYARELYLELNEPDLEYDAFETALKGYVKLQKEGQIMEHSLLTVIDMSVSANRNRFFLIDIDKKKVIHKSIVAHGRNSGGEFAKYFSNEVGSFKSSIGFYKTGETYHGKHGLSLRLDGLEYTNNNARKRAIVVHAADYVSSVFIKKNGRLGRSLGCPSLPKENYDEVIHRIKGGSLLFIYYPEENYLKKSLLANYRI
ncbi:murein L,D-transpeptidase catalytic domain family protein [Lutimonas saemankumensis]|uniref:murein L,D-transpeptidase catalytic domain family protein n=1 Tax=Lutimonas saemankumensis TaxID=483016 RepID=UPI001CD1DD5D|nr:murein L,D-transpeptidase catalytic domain family protein [Lutimonas saemankumensis]MCA0933930.1 murein L,D-transpeptidase catalytic domain family protein [Lutimonas saemankumensis]